MLISTQGTLRRKSLGLIHRSNFTSSDPGRVFSFSTKPLELTARFVVFFFECGFLSFPFPRIPAALFRFHERLQLCASVLSPLAFLWGGASSPLLGKVPKPALPLPVFRWVACFFP